MLWPHQEAACRDVRHLRASGERRIVVVLPTGAGKTRVAAEIVREEIGGGGRAVFYTNRRLLLDQSSGAFLRTGLPHGVRAAGHAGDDAEPFQIASIQTEVSRINKSAKLGGAWQLHAATLVVIDECHLHASSPEFAAIRDRHLQAGATVVGLTATPFGLADAFDVIAGDASKADLRAAGVLVPAHHYAPDEPDLKAIGRVVVGQDFTEKQGVKAIMRSGVFGRVLDHWRRLNPQQLPTLLFAPGVSESRWFAAQLVAAGIRAAHVDGDDIVIDGSRMPSDRSSREYVLRESQEGRLPVICNRFVMREGLDAPWITHGIFACVVGSPQSYLQMGGRFLRAHPGKTHCVIQDHGANWWRHGSLNADRVWHLGETAEQAAARREDDHRDGRAKEPYLCPRCGRVLTTKVCPCGHEAGGVKPVRMVVQSDGTLKAIEGPGYAPRKVRIYALTHKQWARVYYRAKNSGMTFRQAYGLFCHEFHYYPPKDMRLMPKDPSAWFRRVKDVPPEELR